jgi:hypothetical protein
VIHLSRKGASGGALPDFTDADADLLVELALCFGRYFGR